jgi:hypothetical protein
MGLAAFSALEPEHYFFILGIWSCRLHQSSARARASLFGYNVKNRVDKTVYIILINYNFIFKIIYLIKLIGAQGGGCAKIKTKQI